MFKLLTFPKNLQGDPAFFIADGRTHFSAAYRLMNLPALDKNGSPLQKKDNSFYITPEYLRSALILFQISFELLLKSLIKVKGRECPRNGWKGHDLAYLWDIAVKDFQRLSSIQQDDLGVLKEMSSIISIEGKDYSNLMRLKYGECCVWLPENSNNLLESFLRIYQLIIQEINSLIGRPCITE